MCAIAGIIATRPYPDPGHLDLMRDAMAHRGPDGAGTWWSDDHRAGLAHRRLAILDLSPTGAQPMASEDGHLVVTFNGEIYNHHELREELRARGYRFRGASDTEVLLNALHAWGDDAVQRLSGMFAFAAWDRRQDRLVLARDRVGEKPLFWSLAEDLFTFASELKGLMARPGQKRRMSAIALDEYLGYGAITAPGCMLAGVSKLPPAHLLVWKRGEGRPILRRYWDLPDPAPRQRVTAEDLADELHALLRDSVRRQLAADVPVGVLLSGGIDSSLITAIAAEVSSQPVRTFTVGFPGHPAYDERPHARLIADHFATSHIELEAHSGSLDLIDVLARHVDEPMCDSSIIPTFLVSQLVRKHCTVVLGGDGGDELFGGYRSYQGALRLDAIRAMIPYCLRWPIGVVSEKLLPFWVQSRNGISAIGKKRDCADNWGVFFSALDKSRMYKSLFSRLKRSAAAHVRPSLQLHRGAPGAWMRHDFATYLPDDILVKVDRASMATSLEIRAPFLSPEICAFAFRECPNELRATTTQRKIVLRTLAKKILPRSMNIDRKQGFSIPLSSWITKSVISSMHSEGVAAGLWGDGPQVHGTLATIARHSAERFFMLLLLVKWLNQLSIQIDNAP